MKKTLNLQEVINLQKTVEALISDTQVKIIANNPVLKSSTEEIVDVGELYSKYNSLLDQLTILKLAKDKANRKRTRLGGVTNQELILERGNLQRKAVMLEEMFKSKLKSNKFKFQITKSEIEDDLDIVNERIDEISKSMTNFNTSTTVKVVIFEELNLL